MVLLMAVTHSSVAWCKEETDDIIQENRVKKDFLDLLTLVYTPFKTAFSTSSVPSSAADTSLEDDAEEEISHNSEGNQNVGLSPNFLSLFVEKVVLPKHSPASPLVNFRRLKIERVWSLDAIQNKEDPGILASLLGIGINNNQWDKSLSTLPYLVFPYKVKESEMQSNSNISVGLVSEAAGKSSNHSQLIFSQDVDCTTRSVPQHTTVADFVELAHLLQQVC
jgi:hypothetical protein